MSSSPKNQLSSSLVPAITAPWWGRISLLWLMFMPLCVILYSLLLPIAPNDFWYHARAGSITATTGHIPTQNLFSTGVPLDRPYYNQGWIAHWAFYKILESGGLAWIAILRSACMGLAYALVTWAAFRRARRVAYEALRGDETPSQLLEVENGAARVAALGALLTFGMSALNMDIRPQTFSFPLFALFTLVIYEWPFTSNSKVKSSLFIALLCACMALWSNLHGAFFTALVMVWMLLVGESAYAQLHDRWHLPFLGRPLPANTQRLLIGLAILCVVSATINPHGSGIFSYAVNLANNPIGQQFIQEWKHPGFDEWNSDVFFLAPLLLAFLIYRTAPRSQEKPNSLIPCGIRAGELLVLLALMTMGLRNVRAIVWFALFFAPAFAGTFMAFRLRAGASWHKITKGTTPEPTRGIYVMNAIMACFILSLVIPALPWFKPQIPFPPAYLARFAPTPRGAFPVGFSGDPPLLLENTTPVEAAQFLREHPPRGRLYNEMVFGSYLMWALYPKTLPNADPRIELYPNEHWLEYLKFQDNPRNASEVLLKQGYTDALLNPKLQKPLVEELSRTPGWKKYVFKHGPAILFRHQAP